MKNCTEAFIKYQLSQCNNIRNVIPNFPITFLSQVTSYDVYLFFNAIKKDYDICGSLCKIKADDEIDFQ